MTVLDAPLSISPPRVTAEELLRMPDNSTLELVDGRIVEKNVSLGSSDVEAEIVTRFRQHLRQHPVARSFPASLGHQCFQSLPRDPERVRKPDCTVVLNERLAALPVPGPGYMPIVPDLAVRVLSPNDTNRAVGVKLREYRAAGFPLVWVVDPEQRIVTVHPNPGKPYVLSEDDEVRAESVLPGFACRMADLFPSPVADEEP